MKGTGLVVIQAADALRKPFVLGDRDALAALVEDAGIPDAAITTRTARSQGTPGRGRARSTSGSRAAPR